ncbi:Na+/H+ antiporter NhaA [Draconibacterium sp. IB214405]|uniref:Na+/H+ antiporter NhaA n=1 Tax=Draconibacterium sp. IB214405 TaxID=3097352 RepID=UPI002A15AC44|nr:Na+/H+ antiporter NhaA [Draconibacterium sp. IB214405]MDX8339240.1 Na+/H+ antiporter NhaA [Draconibacterium sp. IB214405]
MKFIKDPINQFVKLETSSSIVLFTATIAALLLANSPLGHDFLEFWKNYITFSLPGFELSKPIYKWINDGLMAIFFFLIGLEIKREILSGELSHVKKASLPFFAAVGGMIIPAVLFTVLNTGNAGGEGWGIPMAADIAFSLGILTLLGNRVPNGIKVFLMAFAIIDDLGAVLVIAFFYSTNLIWANIFIGLGIVAVLIILARFNAYSKYLFFIGGIIVWVLFLKSGIHATIAGVLMALTIPLRRKTDTRSFYERGKELLDNFLDECTSQGKGEKSVLTHKQMHAIEELEELAENTTSPLQHSEHMLHGWVSYLIMPIFAFANAGVAFKFSGDTNLALSTNIALSMIVGNFIGIFSFSWLSIKLNIAELPKNVNFKQLAGVSFLGGLGFTMSLFINNLAYSDAALIDSAKMGILIGSLIAGTLGYITIRLTVKATK